MNGSDDSRLDRLHQVHFVYALTLFVCGLATLGEGGIILVAVICGFWGLIFTSRSRPRAFTEFCLFLLLLFGSFVSLSVAMGYSPRSAARRMTCSNQLKQIAIAIHNYHDIYGSLPPAYIADSDGRPAHSWRVLVLPFLEEEKLYEQYSFDEPWDGPNNRKLLDRMPQVYACPSVVAQRQPVHNTSYVAVTGPRTAWPSPLPRSFSEIQDGTSSTALVIEHHNSSIPWLEPSDLAVDDALQTVAANDVECVSNHNSESFFYEYPGGRLVALADGSVQYVSQGVGRTVWAALFGVDDGIRWSDEDLDVPAQFHRRLKTGNCVRLSLFVLLSLWPLPWVWLNPNSRH